MKTFMEIMHSAFTDTSSRPILGEFLASFLEYKNEEFLSKKLKNRNLCGNFNRKWGKFEVLMNSFPEIGKFVLKKKFF